jgi:murein DD-endopeptidase MepM/ murein hydrolase activator NlpD
MRPAFLRRGLLAAPLLALAACLPPARAPRAMTDAEYLRARELMVPVHGVSRRQLRDTYNAARSGGRAHRALDIMARRGTRVLSADDGTVLRVTTNPLGGKVVYIADPHRRFVHYYAHLDQWVYPLKEGQRVRRGELIGSVGSTGNAPENAPHLHYQLLRVQPGTQYWNGPPVNPIPYLTRKGNER